MIKRKIKFNKKKGLTLIESLVYIGLFAIFFPGMIGYVIFIFQNNKKADIRKETSRAIILVNEHMQDTFSKSNSIDIANTVFNDNNGKIRLITSSDYYEYSISNNRIQVNKSGSNYYLTDPYQKIQKFYIEEIKSKSGSTIGAKISINLNSIYSSRPVITESMNTMFSIK